MLIVDGAWVTFIWADGTAFLFSRAAPKHPQVSANGRWC